ncbi:PLP-dependent cysteine synthase family protein [Actinomycetospora rhizophila]|uniref:PLP-dependent cysteine synthase family protein n=1 Tax=Actinomycetospora rhizophila TaxID=1416876 RepID=A0ABV9Z5F8_9PSEU
MSAPPLPSTPGAAGGTPRATEVVGNTPVVWIDAPFAGGGRGFWAKLEGTNPGGIKDRPALHMVRRARERGDLQPGCRIVESTSGTLGLGLALAGIAFGHPVTLVSDPGMEPLMYRLLQAYGTELETVPAPAECGGWQQARRDRVARLLADDPGAWCPDQYHNPDNVEAYTPLAEELWQQLGAIDTLVCSVGTGGHSAGISRALRRHLPDLEVVGVDTVGSTIFGQPARPRVMRGLGSSIHPRNVDYPTFSEVHWVAAQEAVPACRAMAIHSYASGGWSVGAVGTVAGWLARTRPHGTRIAAVFPDGPERYFDTVYNDEFCEAHGLAVGDPPLHDPMEIERPDEVLVERWTRCRTVLDPAVLESAENVR